MSYQPFRVFLHTGSAGIVIVCAFFCAISGSARTAQLAPRALTYFVDCSSNAPKNDGRSADSPWTTLEQINGHAFAAGDEVRFKRGSVCHGILWPKGSGSDSAPIRMTAYGTGLRPKIVSNSGNEASLKLFNQEYWNIDSLDFSGANKYGIFVSGDKGILHHIHLANLLVHDVGGVEMKNKESGLVVISPGSVDQRFDDVLVDGVTAYNTRQWVGILIGGGNFGFPPENTWSTHVTIRDSLVHDVQGDGIVLFRVRDGRITSNRSVMMGAGLLAKKAVAKGLTSKPWVKTSLAPGSKVVFDYLTKAGLMEPLEALKFNLVGYGCTTCIGNSGPLPDAVSAAVKAADLVVCSVLSGNRNFEGRIQSQVRANYLVSPPLVVAYALAGRMTIDLTSEPLGKDPAGKDVY